MPPNQKRQRGRNSGNRRNYNHSNRVIESNGPEIKIRGTAQTVYEKYVQIARDEQSGGDRIRAESLLQHAEHYYRVNAAQQQARSGDENNRQHKHNQQNRHSGPAGDQNENRDDVAASESEREKKSKQKESPLILDPGGERDDAENSEKKRIRKPKSSVTAPKDEVTAEKNDETAPEDANEEKPRRRRTRKKIDEVKPDPETETAE